MGHRKSDHVRSVSKSVSQIVPAESLANGSLIRELPVKGQIIAHYSGFFKILHQNSYHLQDPPLELPL